MSNICPECDGERVVVEGTGQQADFAPCPRCSVVVEEKRVFSPEEHGVLDYNTLPKAEVPDVVVEQGPNTNGDIFPKVTEEMLPEAAFKEPVVRGALKQLLEQDIYKRTAEEAQQRLRDLADLSFRPAYVTSKPDPKSIMAAMAVLREGGIFFAKGETKFFLDPPGWDANGSPTEEWP